MGACARAFRGATRWRRNGLCAALLVCFWASTAAAQALMEYGQATASASAKVSAAARSVEKGITLPANRHSLPLTSNSPSESAEAANRNDLAAHAGKHATKLLLRSTPNHARVRIDGKAVGETPVLLILAPGVYAVEMEGGARVDSGSRRVGLLPGEAREILLHLAPRYPARIRISWPSHDHHEQGSQNGRT